MNCSDFREKLHDHVDHTLAPADRAALEAHLATCPACRAQLDSLRALRAAAKNLPRDLAPSRDLWPDIEANLKVERVAAPSVAFGEGWAPNALFPLRPTLLKLAAVLALLAVAGAAWNFFARPRGPAWQIASLAGAPRLDSKSFQGESRFHVGQWLETDAASRAKVSVGNIGEVNVDPNSRLRLVDAAATDHRLELTRGTLHALIWSPPRLFFVDTPSATAVDLGCQYTLAVDDSGTGTLTVTAGYVALQHDGRESIIPAGQMCSTRRGFGPGTPYAVNAPLPLRHALERFDFEHAASALPEILAQARPEDSITLYHLLSRTSGAERGAVFDKLARDHAPPAGVTRAGILAGNATMLAHWAGDLGVAVPAATLN